MAFSFFGNHDKNKSSDPVNSKEYEKLAMRIVECTTAILSVENKLNLLKTDVENLRGKFNQRLRGIKLDEQVKELEQQKENFNNNDVVPFG